MRILRWAGRFWTGVLAVMVALAGLLIGLRLLLPIFDVPPTLRDASPPDGADGVAPRVRLTLHFDRPMNPASVVRALSVEPPLAWVPLWSGDRGTLTISPTAALRSDTIYAVAIGPGALSQWFRALAQPAELRFHTALAPAVVTALPADNAADVALDAPISLRFSRTIVPPAALMHAGALPELQFEPPLAGRAIWLDPATVLFRPSAPLRPGTRYRATLAATLTDVHGGQLSQPFTWSFGTAAPRVLAVAPADGARLVAPRATLALTVSQPLALTSLRATLAFSPTVAGQLATVDLADGRQLITFRPDAELRPNTTYTATLAAGAAPVGGNLPLLKPVSWRFTTAPQPALIGRFPGEGQTLPNGQEIRLVFSTPMDQDAFGAALQITPPAPTLRVASSNSEIRISADLQAATVYTMTLPATLADRNGIALGQEYHIRFLTAPSGPTLELPEVAGHVAQIVPGRVADLLVRRTNLSALDADLYQLDEAATVRVLGFHDEDWGTFQPERYSQPLLRSWRIPLADALNTVAEDRLALQPADQPLTAGAYYLRLRSLEGPRADLLLLVARARLTLQAGGPAALVWATDVISGTPIAGLPVALYRAGALVETGTTDAGGTLRFANLSRAGADYIAIAGGSPPVVGGAASVADQPAGDLGMITLTTDRATYRPGEQVRLAGFVRATDAPSGTLAFPPGRMASFTIRHDASTNRLAQATASVGPTGVFSVALALAQDVPIGQYTAIATINGIVRQTSFRVQSDPGAALRVAVATPVAAVASQTVPITVTVRTLEGLPAAGATISWTLTAARAPFPAAEGTIFGDDERLAAAPAPRSGVGQSDANGQLSLALGTLNSDDVPLRYQVGVQVAEPGGQSAVGAGAFVVAPAPRSIGLRVPSRIATARIPGALDLIALDATGQPAPRANVRVEVYRRTWVRATTGALGPDGRGDLMPDDRPAFTRSLVTGADGTASLPLTLPAGGEYRLRVSTLDGDQPEVASATTLWATAPGFMGWGELPGDAPLLIADRAAYRPGETATLLVTSPLAQATALITRGGAGGIAGEVRELRAGATFTLTVQPDDPPELLVGVLLAAPAQPQAGAAADPPALPSARTVLSVVGDRQPLDVAIATDRASYASGATAALTITTSAGGAGVAADVLLDVVGAAGAPFQPSGGVPTGVDTPAAPLPDAPPITPVLWNPALRTNASGVLTLTVPLPDAPADLRALVWAASADRFGQASSTLAVTQPLSLRVIAPPAFRAGDQVALVALVENTSPATQDVAVRLAAAGIQLQPGSPLIQHAQVAAGATARITWVAQVGDAAGVRLNFSVGAAQDVQIDRATVSAPSGGAPRDGGVALLREYLDPQTGQPLDVAQLRAGQLVRARLTLVIAAAQRGLVINEPIPAGAQVVDAAPGMFDRVARLNGYLALEQAVAAPGITQYEYLLRLVAAGSYGAPAPTARAADGVAGVGNAMQIEVAGR